MNRPLRSVAAALAGLLIWTCTAGAAAGPAQVFTPILPKLRAAKIPVYLPAWLPRYGRKVYPFVTLLKKQHAYDLELSYVAHSAGTATLAMYMTAGLDTLSAGPKPAHVALGQGIIAQLGSIPGTASDSLTIRWKARGVVYVIGHVGNATLLTRIARSLVRVK